MENDENFTAEELNTIKSLLGAAKRWWFAPIGQDDAALTELLETLVDALKSIS